MTEAMRTRSFWLLLSSFVFCFIFLFVPFVHLIMIGIETGIERSNVVFAASLIGIAAIFGRLGMGLVSDLIGRKRSLTSCIGLQAISWIWVIYIGKAPWMIHLFAVVFGFSYGGISTMLPAIVGDFFGRTHAGSITGIVFGVGGMCTALGPVITGGISDRMGSYHVAFLLAVVANAASFLLISFTGPPERAAKLAE